MKTNLRIGPGPSGIEAQMGQGPNGPRLNCIVYNAMCVYIHTINVCVCILHASVSEEFAVALKKPHVKDKLNLIDVPMSEMSELFGLLDSDGSGSVTIVRDD